MIFLGEFTYEMDYDMGSIVSQHKSEKKIIISYKKTTNWPWGLSLQELEINVVS